jgi:hypothetical protein
MFAKRCARHSACERERNLAGSLGESGIAAHRSEVGLLHT